MYNTPMANVLLGSIFAERTDDALVIEKIGTVARTDEQIKLATLKLVIENLLVCKGL